jgi:hypothetical protein
MDHRFYEGVVGMEPAIAADLYLTCFCEEGDLLSQWRGYGGNDGRYCIQFDASRLWGTHGLVSPLVALPDVQNRHILILDDILDRHVRGF